MNKPKKQDHVDRISYLQAMIDYETDENKLKLYKDMLRKRGVVLSD